MLRNHPGIRLRADTASFLNEVLSLNAQEYYRVTETGELEVVLNEVLSLNAQECVAAAVPVKTSVLNEVLSLNAQELSTSPAALVPFKSSMKS